MQMILELLINDWYI